MAKIDRLGWVDGSAFLCYGVKVGVRVNDPDILQSVEARMPPGCKPGKFQTVDHLYSLIEGGAKPGSNIRRLSLGYSNLVRIARARNFDDVLDAFESHIQLTVAENARRRVFVHAGVVGWQGQAIVIPGTSFSGKTTLVSEFIRAGATYYSDEYAVLDERGRVHPFPRPLGVRTSESSASTRIRAEDMGARVGSKPLPIGLVLSTKYKRGSRWQPRRLTRGKGVLELLANTVSARSQPELALTILPKALESAEIVKGARGEAGALVEAILGLKRPGRLTGTG